MERKYYAGFLRNEALLKAISCHLAIRASKASGLAGSEICGAA
jgi:hypothetical protein